MKSERKSMAEWRTILERNTKESRMAIRGVTRRTRDERAHPMMLAHPTFGRDTVVSSFASSIQSHQELEVAAVGDGSHHQRV